MPALFFSNEQTNDRTSAARRSTMSLRATLRDRLLNAWVGTPWHGDSSKKIHADITTAEAAARPIPGVQTIWETTLHMIAWTEEVASRLNGNPARDPDRGDWPPMPDPTAEKWTETIAQLGAARQSVLDALEKAHEEDLYMMVPKGDSSSSIGNTRSATASGLIEHDVYHLGQIALLKKALRFKG
jgi:uncharacterized damage-inducible protein DinB